MSNNFKSINYELNFDFCFCALLKVVQLGVWLEQLILGQVKV